MIDSIKNFLKIDHDHASIVSLKLSEDFKMSSSSTGENLKEFCLAPLSW